MLFQETPLIFFSITSCHKESYHYLRVQQNVKFLFDNYTSSLCKHFLQGNYHIQLVAYYHLKELVY